MDWTVRTVDGKFSTQYEHTVVITKDDPLILTEQDWFFSNMTKHAVILLFHFQRFKT
ncbi:hypothetical protein [Brevibacillus laterosporus]|nr:hypothetical protein [Brevibacillus laterosporus]